MRRATVGRVLRDAAPRVGAACFAASCLAASLSACHVSIGIGVGEDASIDAGNAANAAASGFDSLVSLAGPGLGIADEPSRVPAGERPRRALAPGTLDWVERVAPMRANPVQVSGGRLQSDDRLACDAGSARVRAVFANPVAFGAGDTVELDADDCRFGGIRFVGRLAVSVTAASGYPGLSGTWSGRLAVDYSGWRVETVALPLQARSFTGPAVLDVQRLDALDAAIDFDSAALSVDPVISGAARDRRVLELLTLRLTDGPAGDSLSAGYDLVDARFAGTDLARLRVRSEGLVELPGSPSALPLGALVLTASDGSAVRAHALDATRIRLELDRYLDGVVDATLMTTWSGLRGLL